MIVTQLTAPIAVHRRRQMGFEAGKMGVMAQMAARATSPTSQGGNIPLTKHGETLDLSALPRQLWRFLYQFTALTGTVVRFLNGGRGGIRASGPARNRISIRPREIFRNATRHPCSQGNHAACNTPPPPRLQNSRPRKKKKRGGGAEPIRITMKEEQKNAIDLESGGFEDQADLEAKLDQLKKERGAAA